MISKGEDFPLVYPALLCVSGNLFHMCNPWRAKIGACPPPPSDWGEGTMGHSQGLGPRPTPAVLTSLSISRTCAASARLDESVSCWNGCDAGEVF